MREKGDSSLFHWQKMMILLFFFPIHFGVLSFLLLRSVFFSFFNEFFDFFAMNSSVWCRFTLNTAGSQQYCFFVSHSLSSLNFFLSWHFISYRCRLVWLRIKLFSFLFIFCCCCCYPLSLFRDKSLFMLDKSTNTRFHVNVKDKSSANRMGFCD